jgi:diaminohydroxyphosphoribosylaminopyrimidine deaminase/5-amino-6-(5-phosphoribosylamino)uracil reductase
LIAAGVGRVVIAVPDPDPRVNGAGIKMLEKAGIEVLTGEGAIEGSGQLAGYLKRVADGRPMVTVKVATSLDGKIALHDGKSRWITGSRAREQAHLMRARHDGIMVGLGTVVADDPELTCRLPGLAGRSPIRIIADSRLRTPLTTKLAASAKQTPTWIIALDSAPAERKRAFADIGVEVIEIGANSDGGPDTGAALAALGERGLQSVLVEGGGRLVASLLLAHAVDRLAWFRAPKAIGGDGVPAVAALGLYSMDDAPRFRRIDTQRVGEDILETYAVQA